MENPIRVRTARCPRIRANENDMIRSRGGVGGKYASAYAKAKNVAVIAPDLAKVSPPILAVNEALRTLMQISSTTMFLAKLSERRQSRSAFEPVANPCQSVGCGGQKSTGLTPSARGFQLSRQMPLSKRSLLGSTLPAERNTVVLAALKRQSDFDVRRTVSIALCTSGQVLPSFRRCHLRTLPGLGSV
jgi:hypothetical protein